MPVEQSVEDELPKAPLLLWQKVLPLGLIFFCASFNLTILQSLKDAIMVTAGGAETLPFLASFCVLPASVAFFVLYGKLVRARAGQPAAAAAAAVCLGAQWPCAGAMHAAMCNRLGASCCFPSARASAMDCRQPPAACQPCRCPHPLTHSPTHPPSLPAQVAHLPEGAVFYAAITPLLAFYALFATVLYPAAPGLHPTALMESVMPSWPVGLHGLLKVAGNWVYSLFFCFAELWGAVVISVLFWWVARRLYGLGPGGTAACLCMRVCTAPRPLSHLAADGCHGHC